MLTRYVYSGNLKWVMQVAESLESSMVAINKGAVSDLAAPFDFFKQSGLGRKKALLEFKNF